MKIFLIDKSSNKKMINLGGKITFDKLNSLINAGNSILLRSARGTIQSDLRIKKVPQKTKMDRGYNKIKAYYTVNLQVGKEGFENFSPKQVTFEQNLRFANLDRLVNMLDRKQGIKRGDWVIEKKIVVNSE